jgi:transcriptional regulator with XRE-family HTH domain
MGPSRAQTLGAFLRAHRERLSPSTVGLVFTGRRRTPGLRREEVAQLCQVSTTWYTWLEQGRPVSASAATISRIADGLQLSRAERLYLFEISRPVVPAESEVRESPLPEDLKDLVERMPLPAYVLDRQWNVVLWNRAAARLLRPWLVESKDRNLLHFVFLNPAARDFIVDWSSRARRLAAEFRSDAGRHLDDAPTVRLISGLQNSSPAFAKYWNQQDVREREGGVRKFRANTGETGTYRQLSLIPSANTDLKLVTLIPSGHKSPSSSKLS